MVDPRRTVWPSRARSSVTTPPILLATVLERCEVTEPVSTSVSRTLPSVAGV